MSDGFQPQNMFEVYVKVTLDNIEKKFDTLPCIEQNKRVSKIEADVANMQGKATILGVISGFIAGIVSKLFWNK